MEGTPHAAPNPAPACDEAGPLGRSLLALWPQASCPSAAPPVPETWDVIIVGTGYGGSMAAATLSGSTVSDGQGGQRALQLCILERGQEMHPGAFPSRLAELPGHLRMGQQATGEQGGQAEGLFDLRLGEDVVALVANGVGGGSLINAGVLLEPKPEELRRDDFRATLQVLQRRGWYRRARAALGGQRAGAAGGALNTIALHPGHASKPLSKVRAMQALAGRHARAQEVPITVALRRGTNAAGVELPACTLCGDCMTGCNVGAKDSLDVNALRMAVDAGAQLFTGASVSRIRPLKPARPHSPWEAEPPRWAVEVEHTRPDLQAREARPLVLHARHVILAAGTFGSTELLLRSQGPGFSVSPRLGERFSCNGDNLGAVHRMREATQASADESVPVDGRHVGPTITTALPFEALPRRGSRPFWLQEFSVPGAMRRLFEEIVTTGHALHQLPQADLRRHGPGHDPITDPAAVDREAMGRTLLVGLIGHDEAEGVLKLPRPMTSSTDAGGHPAQGPALGTLRVHWPQARESPTLEAAHATVQRRVDHLRSVAEEEGARGGCGQGDTDGPHWVPNPLWRLLPDALSTLTDQARGPVLTVHPLGGCPMGEDATQGVVDAWGRVFDGQDPHGRAVHPGLAVLDGAIVPESLGANPSLTIAALALRAARALRRTWKLQSGATVGTAPATGPPRARPMAPPRVPLPGQASNTPTQVELIERLTGPVWLDLGDRLGAARPWVVEWTLAYQPVRLDQVSTVLDRTLAVDSQSPHSRLRLYDAEVWEARGLAGQRDEWRQPHAVLEARLSGTLRFLHREDSFALLRIARGLRVWGRHRGGRDLFQLLQERGFGLLPLLRVLGGAPSLPTPPVQWTALIPGLLRTASRAGEVRRFDYRLEVQEVLRCTLQTADGQHLWPIRPGDVLHGYKRLTYAVAGNPWRQLTELQVSRMPGMPGLPGASPRAGRAARGPAVGGTLVLDPRFLASRQTPLLRIAQQQDQVQALADLASLSLLALRLLASIHFWTFRMPDAPLQREPVRLPQPVEGLPPPEVIEWAVAAARPGSTGNAPLPAARVRLTRYPQTGRSSQGGRASHAQRLPALVMIHGYSVSGNTFTHESLKPSAAQWFHRQGRDVWVVDLRTSSALPTATAPWTLEEVALVDLPAVLLHVRQATGGPVDVLAHCIGCVMLSMALLSRPQEVLARAEELDRPPPLDPAQAAALAAFNGQGTAAQAGRPHPTIRRLVLSQKGPVLRYTDANVLRGWFMQHARRWLLRDGFQFRPSARPRLGEQVLDRLLASLPYPDADWQVENPWQPWRRTSWTATRHRMDALYGRDFEAARLSRHTLESLDDLFGPLHLDTVSQTIHFTQADQATDHSGAGDYVTPARLRERWAGIETLSLHGRDNGLADVFTQRLLGLHLGAAGVPFVARTFEGMGHQDLLIGQRAAQVFEETERFLRDGVAAFGSAACPAPEDEAHAAAQGCARPPALAVRAPWLGPRLDVEEDRVRVAAMPPLDAGLGRLVLVPVRSTSRGWRLCGTRFALARHPGRSRHWQFAWADRRLRHGAGRGRADATDALPTGWLALFVYAPGEQQDPPLDAPWPGLNGPPPVQPTAPHTHAGASLGEARRRLLALGARSIRRWLGRATAQETEACLVPQPALQRLIGTVSPPPHAMQVQVQTAAVRLAVASCQYPHGPLDLLPAQASLQRMAHLADAGDLDLALFLGDQVYADATAGLVDPARRDERYETPHERAQRAPGMRRVLARLPCVMLADDHEFVDNWEPPPLTADPGAPLWPLRASALRDGRWAYWKYERLRPQARHSPRRALADKDFRFAGLPIYLADTRTGRGPRSASTPPRQASILAAPGQFAALEDWLWRHRDLPKVVATPSMLLPRHAEIVRDGMAAARSDGWDGYPASLERLLDFLLLRQIQHTVFLSGDEHHALVCEVTLAPTEKLAERVTGLQPVRLTSVHSSALYAPFPFANGHPADLCDAPFTTQAGTRVTMKTTTAAPGDGWTCVSVTPGPGGGAVRVQFFKA